MGYSGVYAVYYLIGLMPQIERVAGSSAGAMAAAALRLANIRHAERLLQRAPPPAEPPVPPLPSRA